MNVMISKSLLWLYNNPKSRNKGRIPLGFSSKAILLSIFLAFIFGILLGNAFLKICYQRSTASMQGLRLTFPATAKTSADKLEILLSDYRNQIGVVHADQDNGLAMLLDTSGTEFSAAVRFIQSHIRHERSGQQIAEDIHGRVQGSPFLVLNRQKIPSLLASEYGLTRPNPNAKKLSQDALNYYLIWNLIADFRQKHKNLNELNVSYWLLNAFGGYLQWIIFIVAICCFLLLRIKQAWANMQKQLMLYGTIPGFVNENLWNIEHTDAGELPFFNRLSRKYPNLMLPVIMIEKVMKNTKEADKTVFETYINEEVELMRVKSYDSYSLVNTLYDSCPAWGFIGTIIGATMAFGHASGVLTETEPTAQGEEMNVLTGDLSISFFTTLTGLLAALMLSFVFSRAKTQEAELFVILEQRCSKELKRFWSENPTNADYSKA